MERLEEIAVRKAEIKALLESEEEVDVEAIRTELDSLEAEERKINEEVELAQRKADEEAEERKKDAELIEENKVEVKEIELKESKMENIEVRNTKEYIDAFAKYVRTGNDKECRALLTDNVNTGVIPVPEFVGEIVAARLKESKILSRVRRMEVGGNVKVGFEYDAPAAGKHTEGGDPIAEEQLKLGIVTLVPSTYKKWVAISDEALDNMNSEALLRYLYDEVARGIVKARENEVVAKILAAPQIADATHPAVAKTGAAAGDIADFINARALLSSAAEDLVIICTPAQYATYRGLQLNASYAADPFDGLEVLFNDTATAPIIGDLSGIVENLPKGAEVQFKFDDKTDMKSDLVNILGRQPSAIELVGNKYFAKVVA